MNLPPFPEGFLPRSPEERLMLVQWGEQCRAMAAYDEERCRAAYRRGFAGSNDTSLSWSAFRAGYRAAIDAARNAQHSTDGETE